MRVLTPTSGPSAHPVVPPPRALAPPRTPASVSGPAGSDVELTPAWCLSPLARSGCYSPHSCQSLSPGFSPQEGSVRLVLLGRKGARQHLLNSLAERKAVFYCFGIALTGINPLCAVLLWKFLNTRYLCEWETSVFKVATLSG